MSELDVFLSAVRRQDDQDQLRENGARTANFSATYVTNHDGDLVVNRVLDFGCTFSERPFVTSAPVLIRRPDQTKFSLPRVNCGVFSWVTQKSPAGLLYTGCYLYFTVDVQDLTGAVVSVGTEPCVIEHHIRFDGTALKRLPEAILE